ncbi:cobalt ECF transporter T component CbiQ [Anaerocolumna sp. MB42-C2]|uniref:cobalt ECF transporter T component CbiQ n=1 Tax=Anaerocolumna sp. MB42-C2 TaxID=3070997 RepID=UPI0027E111DC|nr:cobalt ECF transporter T component CbiQ [Anaerocolumna sp. MB42-C2]WMJ87243.1 cobalt ECF transporter T component CbiQ [Anaerocolumna sp. MB42-C2]
MILTALLTIIVIWCLFYAIIPNYILLFLGLLFGGIMIAMSRHKHEGFMTIDAIAQNSRLNKVHSSLKFCTVLILMILSIVSHSPIVGLFLTVFMLILIVIVGGMELQEYFSILSLPVSFLLISGLALLFEYSLQSTGAINLPIYHGYLIVSKTAQLRAALVMSKALGAISCLYLLSLTTPMSEIIDVLRRFHTPDIIVELMYLIYRYTFILLEMHHSMKDAAKSRLGFINYSISIQTTGKIYFNLLSRSYQQANKNFDAMESRCYTGEIRFLESKKEIRQIHIIAAVCLIIFTLGITVVLY